MKEGFDFFSAEQATADAHAATKLQEPRFLGLNEAEAVALANELGVELRMIREDRTPLHLDFRPQRLTLDIRTCVVTRAEAG